MIEVYIQVRVSGAEHAPSLELVRSIETYFTGHHLPGIYNEDGSRATAIIEEVTAGDFAPYVPDAP